MPNSRFDLAEIARSALNDMPEDKRAAIMAEMLTELRGPHAIEHLSKVRAVLSLRMQEMIDEKLPLDDLVAIYGGPASVHARMVWPQSLNDEHERAFVVARTAVSHARKDALKSAYDFAVKTVFEAENDGRHLQGATAAVIANAINDMIRAEGCSQPIKPVFSRNPGGLA